MPDMDDASVQPKADDQGPERLRTNIALLVAIIAVIGFASMLIFLSMQATSASEETWQRLIYLLGGIEAIVFTAVGWLFGKEVNRKQAESAEANAEKATEQTAKAADLKARGEAVTEAILSRESPTAGVRTRSVGGQTEINQSGLTDLARFAINMFPPK